MIEPDPPVASPLGRLLEPHLGAVAASQLLATVKARAHAAEPSPAHDTAPRALLAEALGLLLFHDLLARVPTGRAYVDDRRARGEHVVFDHGAVRTVAAACGALPRGEGALTRVLLPLGYTLRDVYPLPRLRMTGRAYAHEDDAEGLPQYFVAELHPEQFSPSFQATVARVVGASRDPLSTTDLADLEELARAGELPFARAQSLLPRLVACFGRQHAAPTWSDYLALAQESPEMAWISTEGNAFNHATDRVSDLEAVVAAQRALGRPIKDRIEVSRSGRVLQTAFRADRVLRTFAPGDGASQDGEAHEVPGSFYEMIQRAPLPASTGEPARLDLAFDAANATGIFGMTSGAPNGASPT